MNIHIKKLLIGFTFLFVILGAGVLLVTYPAFFILLGTLAVMYVIGHMIYEDFIKKCDK